MSADEFFVNYKDYMIFPDDDPNNGMGEDFVPQAYEKHYIITLSLYDSLLSSWAEARKFEVCIETSLKKVIDQWNKTTKKRQYIQLLECNPETTYLVLALSLKTGCRTEEELKEKIDVTIEKEITNALFVGERWYSLVGEKGRRMRKLFKFIYKEYTPASSQDSKPKPGPDARSGTDAKTSSDSRPSWNIRTSSSSSKSSLDFDSMPRLRTGSGSPAARPDAESTRKTETA